MVPLAGFELATFSLQINLSGMRIISGLYNATFVIMN